MSTLGLGCRAGQRPIILGRMTDPVDHELPDSSHTLAFLELNGIPIKKLPHPVIPTDDDVLLIEIVPIGPGRSPGEAPRHHAGASADGRSVEEQSTEPRRTHIGRPRGLRW